MNDSTWKEDEIHCNAIENLRKKEIDFLSKVNGMEDWLVWKINHPVVHV